MSSVNDDITYFYKKGEGWVPARYEQLTAVIEKYLVTVIERRPERKEHFVLGAGDEVLQEYFDAIVKYDRYKFQSNPRWYYSCWNKESERSFAKGMYDNCKFFTVKFEKIKPPKKVKKTTTEAPAGIFAELEINPPRRRPRRAR